MFRWCGSISCVCLYVVSVAGRSVDRPTSLQQIQHIHIHTICCRITGTYNKVFILILILIYLLTAIGLSPSGSSTVHIYTQTVHRTTQNKQYIEQHKNFRTVRTVPRLGELYPGICLTTEERARKTLSQGSRKIKIPRTNNLSLVLEHSAIFF